MQYVPNQKHTLIEPRANKRRPLATSRRGRLRGTLARMDPVTLAQLDQAQLHDRVETKVIMRADAIPGVLDRLGATYFVMDHAETRLHGYSNTYFDTPELRNYRAHHNRRRRRTKVRYRSYLASNLTFFEVKRRVGAQTSKVRRASAPVDRALWPDDGAFLEQETQDAPNALVRSIVVRYDRILLVDREFSERVTIDTNLRFSAGPVRAALPGVAIVEFKQPRFNRNSPAVRAIPRPRQTFSKYCIGLATCDPDLKQNHFKRVFRSLAKLGVSPIRCVGGVA